MGRVVRAYADALFPRDGTSNVWVLPGRMTAMLRRRWQLYLPDHNAKGRDDHRHHAPVSARDHVPIRPQGLI